MKITGLRPEILAKDPTSIVELFTELGFEKEHSKNEIGEGNFSNVTLKDANGNSVYIAGVPSMQADVTAISINVDNLEEAIKIAEKHGFKSIDGKVTNTGSSKAMALVSPTGVIISFAEHTK